MSMEKRKPNYLEVGSKTYYYLDEICDYLEIYIRDAYEFLVNNGNHDWWITSTGEILTETLGFRALMIDKDSDKYSFFIEELELYHEQESIVKEVCELLDKNRELDKQRDCLIKQQYEIAKQIVGLENKYDEIDKKHH